MFEIFLLPATWISLLTLTLLEIVLGIDNVVFISILVGRLPVAQQEAGRRVGLMLALIFRIVLLFLVSWMAALVKPLFSIFSFDLSGRDLIMIGGGLFLIAKSTMEIHTKLEGENEAGGARGKKVSFWGVIVQVILLDIVFSLDSVITAVGLVDHVSIMIVSVIVALAVMLIFAKTVSDFVHHHPTMKMLALSFLLMIGLLLFVEGLHVHVPKGYVYFAMAFSLFVEVLNLRLRKASKPIELREPKL